MQTGPIPAEIAIITDWSEPNGFNIRQVTDLLSKLGIEPGSCFITSLLNEPPPRTDGEPDIEHYINDRKTCPGTGWTHTGSAWIHPLLKAGFDRVNAQLNEVKPKLVISLGVAPLLLLTNQTKLESWCGSRLSPPDREFTVLPTFHPRRLIKQPDQRFMLQMDLTRAYNIYTGKQVPKVYDFFLQPSFETVVETLQMLLNQAYIEPIKLSGDIETRAGHIACMGIAWSDSQAICIPHFTVAEDPFYWPAEQEAFILKLYGQLFRHKNITWVGQNFSYDVQYFLRHWGIVPRAVRDTMIGHHALHSNIKKGLDFLSRMYADDHIYWKDEIKEWDPKIGEKQYWGYNCKDACITWEIDSKIQDATLGREGHSTFQQSQFWPVQRMMNRGIKRDAEKHKNFRGQLLMLQQEKEAELNWLVGREINPRSSKQLIDLFYKELGIPGIRALGKETLTTNSPTMQIIAETHPMLQPLCKLIVEIRSISVFLSTFIEAKLDIDGRLRSDFAIAGPTSYRYASRENAFGSGHNFQNIPVKEKQKVKGGEYVKLPNIRELFIPDQGKTFFDIDLDRADMQIVGWESGDENLKLALKKGIDLHCMSAAEIFGIRGIPVDELIESHPNYLEHRAKIGKQNRDKTKNGGHACDYGVGVPKLAQTLGITRHEAEAFRARWFNLFPGIRAWQVRVEQQVLTYGFLENPFGARLYNFGRFNLPEFLGWLPQSTVAGVINRGLVAIDHAHQQGETTIELLIQVHDSLAGQFPTYLKNKEIANLRRLASVIVPYEDPLIIPVGVKTSEISWGQCA